jgi:hypothetical protein
MALMIDFGTAACWKIRSLSIAREAVWSTRWPRSAEGNPRPGYWPASAGVGESPAANAPEVDDPRVDQPVARGPRLPAAVVHVELLDPTRGFRQGTADLTREYPLLAKMGEYHLEANTRLLDDKWEYQRMSWPELNYWLSDNQQRRIPVIYDLAKASRDVVDAYVQALLALLGAPVRPQIDPLDRDDEFLKYLGSAPDFIPRLQQFCSLDATEASRHVKDLVDWIQGNKQRRVSSVADRMAHAFIHLYEEAIDRLQSQLSAISPEFPAQRAAILAEIARLQAKIDALNQFLTTL